MSFLKGLKKAGADIGKELSRGAESMSKEINKMTAGHIITDNFRTQNVVQLVSRSSGRTIQIVTAPNGQLVVDGQGMEGPHVRNASWFVTDLGNNIVTLHNNNNYLAIYNGMTTLRLYPDPRQAGRETQFRLSPKENFVCLESVNQPGCFIGFHNNGLLKSALATGRDIDGCFGVRLIYSPYPPPGQAGASGYKR